MATVVFAGRVPGGVIAYQTAFTFFLLPHAVLAHPIFTVRFPELAAHGAAGDNDGFAADVASSMRTMAMLLAPAAALMAAMAAPLLALIRVGQLDAQGSELVAAVLASFMTGLLGYSCFFLLTRASYAIDDVRSPTTVFLGVTAAAIVGMAVTSSLVDGDAQVIVLGLANGVAVSLGSAALYRRLRRHVDRPMPILATLARVALATAVGGGLAWLAVTADRVGRARARPSRPWWWGARWASSRTSRCSSPCANPRWSRSGGGSGREDEAVHTVTRSPRPPVTSQRMRIGVSVVLAVASVAAMSAASRIVRLSAVPATEHADRVVVFGVPHLGLGDLDSGAMPTLDRLVDEGAMAAASVRTYGSRPTSVEAYSTMSAGTRVRGVATAALAFPADTPVEDSTAADVIERRLRRTTVGGDRAARRTAGHRRGRHRRVERAGRPRHRAGR